jgi:hypothetical protein
MKPYYGSETFQRLYVTPAELAQLAQLPEYSCSRPTGVTPGKRWRRHNGAHDPHYIKQGGKPYWVIGAYEAIPGDDKMVAIKSYRPCVRVKVVAAPA